MRIKRWRLLVGLCLAAMGFTLLGTALAQGAPANIEFFYVANQSEAEVWKKLVDQFNSEQDKVKVQNNWSSAGSWGEFEEKTMVRLASGDAPDIIRLSDESLGE